MSGDAIILQGYIIPLTIAFTGTPPFSITYSDGDELIIIDGITENPFQIMLAPQYPTVYTLTEMSSAFCDGTVSGMADVLVITPSEPNDICDYALPFPELTIGVESCVAGNNNNANGELPFINQATCGGEEFPAIAADLWYSFVAVSNILDVTLDFAMDTALIAFYEGTCDGLIGRGCEMSFDGTLSTNLAPVTAGTTYYIQVSGGSLNDVGDFTLCIDNYGETMNEICALGQSLVVSPTPVLGTYLPSEAVEFCFSMESYTEESVDWFHGLVPEFGAGWDLSTITGTISAASCAGDTWSWYDTPITGDNSNGVGPQGPGFFYETGSGSTGGGIDGDPGNNYGDAWQESCGAWTFCFTISTVAECPPGQDGDDLSVLFRNFSDSETGSWDIVSICPEDPEFLFRAVLSCCPIPTMEGVFPTCTSPDIGVVTATPSGGDAPFIFQWSTGFVDTSMVSSMIDTLTAGFYTVTVTDNEGCESIASFTLFEQGVDVDIDAGLSPTICQGDGIELNITGGDEYLWSPSYGLSDNTIGNPIANPDTTTNYIVVVTDANGCSGWTEFTVNVLPPATAETSANAVICPGESVFIAALGGLDYAWSPTDGLVDPTAPSTEATPTETTTYTVTVTDANGCTATDDIVVVVSAIPFFPEISVDTTVCAGDVVELQLSDEFPISNYDYQWSPITGLENPTMPNTFAIVE